LGYQPAEDVRRLAADLRYRVAMQTTPGTYVHMKLTNVTHSLNTGHMPDPVVGALTLM
jgi:hypothetical protein